MTEVVKVGGSLFARTDFPPLLLSWLSTRPAARRILVVGGGGSADLVRGWSDRFRLSARDSHGLAVRAMELQSSLAAALLDLPALRSFHGCLQAFEAGAATVLLQPLEEMLAESKQGAAVLPESWDATSDSIAAWAASRLAADRLTLLKSVGDDRARSLAEAERLGWIDPHFRRVVATPTTWVDLASGREWDCGP